MEIITILAIFMLLVSGEIVTKGGWSGADVGRIDIFVVVYVVAIVLVPIILAFAQGESRGSFLSMLGLVEKYVMAIRGGDVMFSFGDECLIVLRRWRADVWGLFIDELVFEALVFIAIDYIGVLLAHHGVVALMLDGLGGHSRGVVEVILGYHFVVATGTDRKLPFDCDDTLWPRKSLGVLLNATSGRTLMVHSDEKEFAVQNVRIWLMCSVCDADVYCLGSRRHLPGA
jgi:hypothetical protein